MELQNPEVREEYEKFQRMIADDTDGNKWLVHLNNFLFNLPGGYMRTYHESSGKLDERLNDLDPSYVNYYLEKSSKLRSSQTNRQFYETVEKALREDGVLESVLKCFDTPPHTSIDRRELYSL